MTRALRLLASAVCDTGEPCGRETRAGVDSLVARPRGGDGPVIVYVNAATPAGVEQPAVARLLGGLARAGYEAVAPELPHVRGGVVTPGTVEALVAVARASTPRVTFLGASTGAALAILAAADPRLTGRVSAVAAVAPFASLEAMLRLGTTGVYDGRRVAAAPLVGEAAARSLRASAPRDRAVAPLLANGDPARFDALYWDLEPATRDLIERLSPLTVIDRVAVPVEIACAPVDRFCPTAESRSLAAAGRDVRLTVTNALEHVAPRVHPGLVHLVGLVDRTLARAA